MLQQIIQENFLSLYCTRQLMQVGIDHCRGYPAFQPYSKNFDNVSMIADMFFTFFALKLISEGIKKKYFEINYERSNFDNCYWFGI